MTRRVIHCRRAKRSFNCGIREAVQGAVDVLSSRKGCCEGCPSLGDDDAAVPLSFLGVGAPLSADPTDDQDAPGISI
jgi:hypothetical protein